MEKQRPEWTEGRPSWAPIDQADCLDTEACTPPGALGPTLSPRIPVWATNPSKPHPRTRKHHRSLFLSESFHSTPIRFLTACRVFHSQLLLVAVEFSCCITISFVDHNQIIHHGCVKSVLALRRRRTRFRCALWIPLPKQVRVPLPITVSLALGSSPRPMSLRAVCPDSLAVKNFKEKHHVQHQK